MHVFAQASSIAIPRFSAMESPSRCPPNVIPKYVSEDVKSTDRRDVHLKAEAKGRKDQKSSHRAASGNGSSLRNG
jgi:hypothetical protein